ncbi:ZIP family metal transporter [Adhaeribacter sp. BT258]|uniref:ZIP family metal transporter n=1 Tax=Adhaeribacter terrigena TaxID=2793070 RepID=A0ABS1C3A9_9BACT|nr:ZIP family metal transporter [Adhaeribacter terrigena]MBK0403657.1 ZIP family metal transporter [Adhaeribacter terrigena]
MILAILILFFTVLFAGWLVRFLPKDNQYFLKILLAFSGAYLFSITILHILPDVLLSTDDPHQVGYYVLAGFFLQLLLELFSEGIEHGHVHKHAHDKNTGYVPFMLLFSLIMHSFLEGSILVENDHGHNHAGHNHGHNDYLGNNFYSVLVGIAIHHIPAAVALMSVLMFRLNNFKKAFGYLFLFAIASPLGILFSNYVILDQLQNTNLFMILSGLVAGNFLHISTTILFETSPDHRFHKNKIIATVAGTLLALASNFV